MEKTIKERRKKFLDETVAYYSEDVTRRAVDVTCYYRLQCEDGTVKKCAIGRHIPDDKYRPGIEGGGIHNENVYNSLPLKIKKLGVLFLSHIQNLHDGNHYWTTEGLSLEGREKYDEIILTFIY